MPIKKTRTDAWESGLTPEAVSKLYALVGNLSYNAAVVAAKEQLQIDLPSSSSFYRFLERMREEDAALRLAKATQVSREVGVIAGNAGISDSDLIRSLQSMGAEAALNGSLDDAAKLIQMATGLSHAMNRTEELRIANEKLKILQAKIDSVRKVCETAKKKGGLTEETLKRIEEAAGLL